MRETSQILEQAIFMRHANQEYLKPNMEQAARYIRHIVEESTETDEAIEQQDAVKLVDGLVDGIVVHMGALISLLGTYHAEQAWRAVWGANYSKVNGKFGPTVFRDDGQVGKPAGWVGPEHDLARIVEESGLAKAMMEGLK